MALYRELLVLTRRVKNVDTRHRTGPYRQMEDTYEDGELFAREITIPDGKGTPRDEIVHIGEDDNVRFGYLRGTPMYDVLLKNCRRSKPCLLCILHEYEAYTPEDVLAIIHRCVEAGAITLQQIEQAAIAHRREQDADMLGEPDLIALPKPGRSKLDADSGGTDPRRDDFDPDLSGYGDDCEDAPQPPPKRSRKPTLCVVRHGAAQENGCGR